jgi:hypothetical protein
VARGARPASARWGAIMHALRPDLRDLQPMNFYEKALFAKADVARPLWG